MKSEDVYWSLYNEVTGRQIDGLAFTQVKGIVESMDAASKAHWLAWHEGLTDWKHVDGFTELQDSAPDTGRVQSPFPPAAPRTGKFAFKDLELSPIDTESLELGRGPNVDNRLNRRFLKNYAVTASYQGGVFKTRTVNISLGGMLVHDPLPDGLGMRFFMTLSRRDGFSVQMQCMRVLGPTGKVTRVRFLNQDDTDLRAWLLDSKID